MEPEGEMSEFDAAIKALREAREKAVIAAIIALIRQAGRGR